MKNMTSETVSILRDAINDALKSVGEAHGVTIHCGNAKYDEYSVTFSLNASIAATEDFDPEREKWAKHVAFTGLTAEDYGTKWDHIMTEEEQRIVQQGGTAK